MYICTRTHTHTYIYIYMLIYIYLSLSLASGTICRPASSPHSSHSGREFSGRLMLMLRKVGHGNDPAPEVVAA